MAKEFFKLGDARQHLGLTADQLASRLGVAQSTIIRAEQSERRKSISIKTLEKTAAALGMEFQYKFITKKANPKLNELERIRAMNVEEKLLKVIELSELAIKLNHASKRAR